LAIQGEYRIDAPRETVWRALNDTDVLRDCIPGCEELVRKSETEIEGRINAQLGPVRSVFATAIELQDMNPPAGYTLVGEGKGVAGFGKGTARVELSEDAGATLLRYTADLKIGGKLAQVGSRLVEGATRQLADQFFAAFAARVVAPAAAAGAGEAGPTVAAEPWPASTPRTPWAWIAVGVVLLLMGLWWWLS
jgi:carbon monoxide dehydrogenase subunit G